MCNLLHIFNNWKIITYINNDSYKIDILIDRISSYTQQQNIIKILNKKLNIKKIRNDNFPSDISENIVKFIIIIKDIYKVKWDINCGDLCDNNGNKIEIKGFSSTDPISFGPKERWNQLYIINCMDYINKNFTIYKINYNNNDDKIQNLQISKKETFKNQIVNGRRPRICFNHLYEQLKDDIEIYWTGNINILYKYII